MLARLKAERGQALILFVGIFTIIMLAGAITVDFGIWMSERRGAQADADFSSLAGAQEWERYLGGCTSWSGGPPPTPSMCASSSYTTFDPEGKAQQWFDDNNNSNAGNASTPIPIETPQPCVKVTAKHDTKALFTGIFGLGPDNIGASAKACAGAITGMTGAEPIEMGITSDPCFTDGLPNYLALCVIESGTGGCPSGSGDPSPSGFEVRVPRTDTPTPTPTSTPTGTPATATPSPTPTPPPCNPHGILDLEAPDDYCSDSGGPPSIEDLINNGATGTCRINTTGTCDPTHGGPWYDCVAVQTGNTAAVVKGFRDRLDRQGPCDSDGDGIADFDETVNLVSGSGATGLYEAKICSDGKISSRIVTIIVLASNPPPGPTGYPILGFAAFYFGGCADDRDPPPTSVEDLDRNCTDHSHEGHIAIYGQFLKLILTNGDVGDPSSSSTLFGVHLVE